VTEDRSIYMREYMRDRRKASKLGLDINAYRELANAGNLPVNTDVATTRTYTRRATTSDNKIQLPSSMFDRIPLWGYVLILFVVCASMIGYSNWLAYQSNQIIKEKE
jgi:hypothetical protein